MLVGDALELVLVVGRRREFDWLALAWIAEASAVWSDWIWVTWLWVRPALVNTAAVSVWTGHGLRPGERPLLDGIEIILDLADRRVRRLRRRTGRS